MGDVYSTGLLQSTTIHRRIRKAEGAYFSASFLASSCRCFSSVLWVAVKPMADVEAAGSAEDEGMSGRRSESGLVHVLVASNDGLIAEWMGEFE